MDSRTKVMEDAFREAGASLKLKIISDGTPWGTKVVNVETGEVVQYVTDVEWKFASGKMAEATIKLAQVPVEIEIDKRTELKVVESDETDDTLH